MISVVEIVSVSELGGYIGSHPKLISSFPPMKDNDIDEKELISRALPEGTEPDCFTLEKYKNRYVLSYIFSVKNENNEIRSDLASISLVIKEKDVIIEDFQKLFKIIIDSFKKDITNLSEVVLKRMLENIYNGVNKRKKIKIQNATIDISKVIKSEKLKLTKEKENISGRLF